MRSRRSGAIGAPSVGGRPWRWRASGPSWSTTARETGALADLPYALVLAVAPVYEAHARYREMGDALAQATMVDVQRRGAEPVFRDDFAHFIPIERDFANREDVLAGAYARAVARLDSVRLAGGR